jgi:hypothetical protein
MRFKTPHYGDAGKTSIPGFNGLVVCYSDTQSAGLCICPDAKLIIFFSCGNQED